MGNLPQSKSGGAGVGPAGCPQERADQPRWRRSRITEASLSRRATQRLPEVAQLDPRRDDGLLPDALHLLNRLQREDRPPRLAVALRVPLVDGEEGQMVL